MGKDHGKKGENRLVQKKQKNNEKNWRREGEVSGKKNQTTNQKRGERNRGELRSEIIKGGTWKDRGKQMGEGTLKEQPKKKD